MKQQRFVYILWVVVLGLLLTVTVVAAASGSNEVTGTGILVLGQPFMPEGGVKDGSYQAEKEIMPLAPAQKLAITEAPDVNIYFVREQFEGVWPNGNWYTYDDNGATGGQVCWDDDSWIHFRGSWSGASAAGCANGIDPYTQYYPNNMDSWMVNGPFSTVNARYGKLNFKYWNQSESYYDRLWWCASPNNVDWYCKWVSGNSGGWKSGGLNLKAVPGYGNMLGDPTVWAAWVFTSDGDTVDDGGFVDNAAVKVWR